MTSSKIFLAGTDGGMPVVLQWGETGTLEKNSSLQPCDNITFHLVMMLGIKTWLHH